MKRGEDEEQKKIVSLCQAPHTGRSVTRENRRSVKTRRTPLRQRIWCHSDRLIRGLEPPRHSEALQWPNLTKSQIWSHRLCICRSPIQRWTVLRGSCSRSWSFSCSWAEDGAGTTNEAGAFGLVVVENRARARERNANLRFLWELWCRKTALFRLGYFYPT